MTISLFTLLLGVFIVSVVLTILLKSATNRINNTALSFLQNFCGFLFIVSGLVKAVDPLGTAYKMGDYFKQFQVHLPWFEDLFIFMDQFTVEIAVGMIVLEIVLGIMLIIGLWRRFTAWTFFFLIVVFTFLTGFTYLTGFVPRGATFFEFSKWDSWVATNMLVTDCGCFGDFIKLEPFVSFMKDVILLIPAFIFILFPKHMHQIFTPALRFVLGAVATFGLIIYCLSNYAWDLPHSDFRPFRIGVNIREQKMAEEEAMANVELLGYNLTNKSNGEKVFLAMEDFTAKFKEYPKDAWDYEQVKTEPAIKSTKLSETEFYLNESNIAPTILEYPGYSFLFVGYKPAYTRKKEMVMTRDTVFAFDTVAVAGIKDSFLISKNIAEIKSLEEEKEIVKLAPAYLEKLHKVGDIADKAEVNGHKSYFLTQYESPDVVNAIQEEGKFHHPVALADELLLKTIIRSNPGLVLMKDGKILNKWHYNKLPDFQEIKNDFLK